MGAKAEAWIIGGAAHPACLPYNDIDIAFYMNSPDYTYIDNLIVDFIREKLNTIT